MKTQHAATREAAALLVSELQRASQDAEQARAVDHEKISEANANKTAKLTEELKVATQARNEADERAITVTQKAKQQEEKLREEIVQLELEKQAETEAKKEKQNEVSLLEKKIKDQVEDTVGGRSALWWRWWWARRRVAELRKKLEDKHVELEEVKTLEEDKTRELAVASGKLEEVKTLVHQVSGQVDQVSGQVDLLIQGNLDCPWLFVLLPPPASAGSWFPCNPLTDKLQLWFLCAHSGQPVGPPLPIPVLKDWVTTVGPVVRFGLQAVKLLLLVGRFTTGFKVDELLPSSVSTGFDKLADFEKNANHLWSMVQGKEDSDALGQLEKSMEAMESGDGVTPSELQQAEVKAQPAEVKAQFKELRTKVLECPAFRAIANRVREEKYMDNLNMSKVTARGEVAWVHNENREAWLQARGGGANGAANQDSANGAALTKNLAAVSRAQNSKRLSRSSSLTNLEAGKTAEIGNGLHGSRSSPDMPSRAEGKRKAAPD